MNAKYSLALNDLIRCARSFDLVFFLALQEVKQKYRRSFFGQLWITFSTGLLVAAMGPLYSLLFNQPLIVYFKYFAFSYIIWTFISTYFNDASTTFIFNESFIKQSNLPYSSYILKTLLRSLIVFLHNFLIILVVSIYIPPEHYLNVMYSLAGILLVSINLYWMGLIVAILSTRYRDVPQLVTSILQLLFFLTPVMWSPDMLSQHADLAKYNFIYHLMEVVRAPLLGLSIPYDSMLITLSSATLGSLITYIIFAATRCKISYWI